MGLQLARAFVTLQLDRSIFESDLSSVQRKFAGAMTTIQGIAAATLGMVAKGAFDIVSGGIGDAADIETSLVAFEVFLGSAEKAKEMFAEVRKFAADTPFDLPETVKASRQLLNAGESADTAMESLEFLGNAAAGAKADLNELVLIYNQIRGTRKLQEQDFRQLTTRSILSMKDIAKYFKVSLQEAEEMKKAGKISFEDVRNVLKSMSAEGGKYEGYMDKIAKTFTGAMTKMRDAISFVRSDIGAHFMKFLTPIIKMVTTGVEAFQVLIDATKPLVPNIMAGVLAVSSMTAAVLTLSVAVKVLGITAQRALIGTGIGIALVAVGVAVGILITVIEKLWNLFAKSAVGIRILKSASESLSFVWRALVTLGKQLYTTLEEIAGALAAAFDATFGTQIASIAGDFEAMFIYVTGLVANFAVNVISWLTAILENWKMIWARFPSFVELAMSYSLDIFKNTMNVLPQLFGFALRGMLVEFIMIAPKMLTATFAMVHGMARAFGQLPGMIKAAISGKGTKGFFDGIEEQMKIAMVSAIVGAKGQIPDLEDLFKPGKGTTDLMKLLEKEMETIRKSQIRIKQEILKGEEEEEKKKGADGPGGRRGGSSTFSVPSGIYDVQGIGKTLQGKLLGDDKEKTKEDQDKRQMDLAEAGAVRQQEALAMNREIRDAAQGIKALSDESKLEEKEMVASLRTANTIAKDMLAAIKNIPQGGLV